MRRRFFLDLAAMAVVAGASAASALAPQASNPVLIVTGAIANPNSQDGALFDEAMLMALGTSTIRTTTPWTDGVVEFVGPTLASVLEAVGAKGTVLHAVAVNDYAIDLDAGELLRYGAMLAMKQDGKALSLRDRGPLWLVLPREQHPELMDEAHNAKWIWQLKTIEIR